MFDLTIKALGLLLIIITMSFTVLYFLASKFPFVNIKEIVYDYWMLLKSEKHRLVFIMAPISLSIGCALLTPVSEILLTTTSTVISILLGLLFAALGTIAGFYSGKKLDNVQKTVFNETIVVILYLTILSIADLFCLMFGIMFGPSLKWLKTDYFLLIIETCGSVIVYALTFSVFANCLIVVKRLSKLIKKD